MKAKSLICILSITLLLVSCSKTKKELEYTDLTWTYTYIKAKEGRKSDLKEILIKNWFAMDSMAVVQGLIHDYELIENTSSNESSDWDYIVAVEYYTKNTYADISAQFETIRNEHETIKVNGLLFPDAGKVIKSEVVKKHR